MLALLVSLGGITAMVLGQAGNDSTPIGAWVSGGGAAAAVSGIVYIARLMATGKLVARDPDAEARALKELLDQVLKLAQEGGKREDDYLQFLKSQFPSTRDPK